jgi:hypothetical protein
MEPASCRTCMYWMQNPETQSRYPPRVLWIDSPNMPGPGMKPDVHSFMPAVHADLWCGEYKFKGSGKAKSKTKK